MAPRNRFRRNSCTRKIAHSSREDAYAALDATLGDRIERMAPYQCDFCGQWHNGHQRVDDVRAEPLPEYEPQCGCRHGADAHDDWWAVRSRCALCTCMRSRQHIYRVELRELRKKQRTLSTLVRAIRWLYFPAMRDALRTHLSIIMERRRDSS